MTSTSSLCRLALAGLLILLICGFSLPFNIRPDYKLDAASGKGLAIFSISADCNLPMSIQLNSKPSGWLQTIGIDQARAFRPSPLQWRDPCGRVVMRELPAGSYEFTSFVIVGVSGFTTVTPQTPMMIPFNVTAGKATYLGHLNFDVALDKGQYRLKIEDKRERDIPLLKEHANAIQDQDVVFDIIQFNPAVDYQPLQGTHVRLQIAH